MKAEELERVDSGAWLECGTVEKIEGSRNTGIFKVKPVGNSDLQAVETVGASG